MGANNCLGAMRVNKLPPLSTLNGFKTLAVPEEVLALNQLELACIRRYKVFMVSTRDVVRLT